MSFTWRPSELQRYAGDLLMKRFLLDFSHDGSYAGGFLCSEAS